jgi:hypothetical protein
VLDEALSYDEDYLIIDCPGQIELYTHLPLMRQLVQHLQSLDFKVVAMYLLDAQFIGTNYGCVASHFSAVSDWFRRLYQHLWLDDPAKFFSGTLSAMSAMLQLEVPHLNVMTKMDLVPEHQREELDKYVVTRRKLLFSRSTCCLAISMPMLTILWL